MKSYFLGAVFVSILLASCATDYEKHGFTGEFSETQLGENIFQISFKGNADASHERTKDFTLLRSAEVTVEKGFRYFIIVDSEKYSKTGTYTTPAADHTTGSANALGNYVRSSGKITPPGVKTFTHSRPTTTNTIVCFNDKLEDGRLVYDASLVTRSIRDKYGMAEKHASFASLVVKSIRPKKNPVYKQASDDVKGWHKTWWGMSPGELEQMYLTNLKASCKDEGGRCIYTLQPVELYGTPVNVEFYLAKGSKLNRVRVLNKFKKGDQLKLAEQIEVELKKKYGNPVVLNDKREYTEPRITEDGRPVPGLDTLELQWIFPSTTITYYRSIRKYQATNDIVVNSVVSLDYQASDHSQFWIHSTDLPADGSRQVVTP